MLSISDADFPELEINTLTLSCLPDDLKKICRIIKFRLLDVNCNFATREIVCTLRPPSIRLFDVQKFFMYWLNNYQSTCY